MPIFQIDSNSLKEGLKKLGVPAAIVTAIVAYLISVSPTKQTTYERWHATVDAYNAKVQAIKKDCKNDKRCVFVEGKERVIFKPTADEIKSRKTTEEVFINRCNQWIVEDEEDAKTYKIKK